MSYRINFITSHYQFYLYDKDSPAATDSPNFWTKEALANKLAVESGILGVGVGTYSYVTAEIILLSQPADIISAENCDHVVEGSLEIKSGILQVLSCPDSAIKLKLTVPPSCYRIRVSAFDLDSIVDEFEEAKDSYRIEIWPAELACPIVLKPHLGAY